MDGCVGCTVVHKMVRPCDTSDVGHVCFFVMDVVFQPRSKTSRDSTSVQKSHSVHTRISLS